ncbi:MAG: ABC transporter permease [Clostridia bacterium]|nr:ABC transporter permease [Clostridia bacterium]
MNYRDIIELCLKNLLRRRTRTLLAITGVVVGTCAIVVMVSIGVGLSQSYQSQIESYGNLHMVTVNSAGGGMGREADSKGVISDKALEKIAEIDGVDAVTPVVTQSVAVGIGKKVAILDIAGVDTEVLEKFNVEIEEGRMLKPYDKMCIIFGNQTRSWFMTPGKDDWSDTPIDVIDDKIILTGDTSYGEKKKSGDDDKKKYTEFEAKGIGYLTTRNDDWDYMAYMNLRDVEKIQKDIRKTNNEPNMSMGKKTYDQAYVYVGDIERTQEVNDYLKNDMGFETYSATDWLEQAKDTSNMIQMILGGIGGISLLVAALGITNTMVMSIYERTREIGVMKVIGANLKDIKRMFLLEAGMIGFGGGAAGLIISYIISLLMNTVLSEAIGMAIGQITYTDATTISVIPWWMIPAALGFSTLIGVAAGYHPAKRAMNLSALESLKNE